MRDLILFAIVVSAAILALRRPWIGILLWTWLSLMNPHRYAWGFISSAPVAAIAAIATLFGMLLASKELKSPTKGTPGVILLLLTIWVTVSWLMGLDVSGDYDMWSRVGKIYLMTFIAISLLNTKHQIMAFAWVVVGSIALLSSKGGLFTILSGGSYRVWGPPGSFIEENNAFAVAAIMTVPMLNFLRLQAKKRWLRNAIVTSMVLSIASALGSHSRGALLALTAMGAVFWWRSPRKGLTSVLILVTVIALLPMMPDAWWDRMATLGTYQEESSAQTRMYAWEVAWGVALHHFFGAGMSYQHPVLFMDYGNTTWVIAAHSIYFQILGNHGFIGLFLFLALWITTIHSAGWLRKNGRADPRTAWTADLGAMIQVALIGYAVGGAFLSIAYYDFPYDLMVLIVITRKWVEERAYINEPDIPFLEYVGLRKKHQIKLPA